MGKLDQIAAELRAAVADEALTLSSILSNRLALPAWPAWMGARDGLILTRPSITRPGEILLLAGSIKHPVLGTAAFSIESSIEGQAVKSRVRWSLAGALGVWDLLAALGLPRVAAAQTFLEGLVAQAVRLQTLADGGSSVSFDVAGKVQTSIGPVELALVFSSLALADRGRSPALLRGQASLGEITAPLTVSLSDPVKVSIAAPDLSLKGFAKALGVELPPLPYLHLLDSPLEDIRFYSNPTTRLSARAELGRAGMLTIVAEARRGEAVLLAGLEVPPQFKFADVAPVLAPLDVLQSILTFGQPALVIATTDVRDFPYPTASGGWGSISATGSPAFHGEMRLTSLGLDVLSGLLGVSKLPFTLPLNADLASIRLTAALPIDLAVIPGVLTIADFSVEAALEPFSLRASGRGNLQFFGEELPQLTLSGGVVADQQLVLLRMTAPWEKPVGLPVVIDDAGMQYSAPPPSYGVFGRIGLASQDLSFAAKFIGQAPSMLVAEAKGEVSLVGLLEELLGGNLLPDVFQPSVTSPSIYIVVNPAGEVVADRHYPAGLGLSGAVEYLGFSAALRLSAKPDRIVAEAGLAKPIRFPPIVDVSGPGGSGLPRFQVDTAHEPIVRLEARLQLLGLVQDIEGQVGFDGVRFQLRQAVGPARVDLGGLMTADRFEADGTCGFGVNATIGPIRLFDGGPNLGSIKLATQMEALIFVRAAIRGAARATFRGELKASGITIVMPEIEVSPEGFARVPQQAIQYIRDNAVALFKDLLTNATLWLEGIYSGVVTGVENVAQVLKEHFEKKVEQIAEGLRDTLEYSADQVAKALRSINESADNIAKALTSIAESPETIAKALVAGSFPADVVAGALKGLGKDGEEVARLLSIANVPADVVRGVIEDVFGSLPNVGIPIPTHIKLPDHVKLPDHAKIPFKLHGKLW